MNYNLTLREINLDSPEERKMLADFLSLFDIAFPEDVEESIGYFDAGNLVATCSLSGKVLKGFAVSEQYRGTNLTGSLVSEILKRLSRRGIFNSFVFTKKANAGVFTALGYSLLAAGGQIVLLENGLDTIKDYQRKLRTYAGGNTDNGSIVMNCNPFTRGHRYLIENAAKQCSGLYIFVVEEDRSVFPFRERIRLVKEGTEDLGNVTVIPGGDYIISSATFPSYFLKKKDERTESQALLDMDIFTRYIAPVLGISKRFAGSEPYDELTAEYNRVMARVLPENNIEFREIPRWEVEGYAVSASRVRAELSKDPCQIKLLEKLLPPATIRFLSTPRGKAIIERIREADAG
jgi:[citrate (pro-3S)-lyase] ligase